MLNFLFSTLKRAQLNGAERVTEGLFILSVVIVVHLFVSLVTFIPEDPSWLSSGIEAQVINNAMGRVGAWSADTLFFLFGFLAYLIPILLFLGSWYLFRWRSTSIVAAPLLTLLRLLGSVVLISSACGLATLHALDHEAFNAGGMIGILTEKLFVPWLSHAGATFLLLALWTVGFTWFTGISWLSISELLGAAICWLMAALIGGCSLLYRASRGQNSAAVTAGDPGPVTIRSRQKRRVSPDEVQRAWSTMASASLLDEVPLPIILPNPNEVKLAADELSRDSELGAHLSLRKSFEEDVPTIFGLSSHRKDETQAGSSTIDAEVILPALELLVEETQLIDSLSEAELEATARLVENCLADYRLQATVVGISPGPVITRFELSVAPGVKAARITSLSRDIARSLSATAVRVVEVIPGKPFVGLELPNPYRETVYLRELLAASIFSEAASPLTLALGKDISGKPIIADLAKMPHLLVAGTTGSGKSVGVNAMILSILYKATPERVRFIMIDPKMLELSVYEGIPHLLTEVVTDMKDAANALRWSVAEMDRRYRLMSALGVRNLAGYNEKISQAAAVNEPLFDPFFEATLDEASKPPYLEQLPAIVVIVDEFADLMMVAGKKVEELIARLAQKARAAGIHLILATQRPSVDVITGLIKANIPTRIAFTVSSKIDSRTILDQMGAESLLGMGDMLYLPPNASIPIRLHGAFVRDDEVHAVVASLKKSGSPQYVKEVTLGDGLAVDRDCSNLEEGEDLFDPLYDQSVAFVLETRRGSISSVQRRFKVGYNRAARLIEAMEKQGIVSSPNQNGNRDVLVPDRMAEEYKK